MFASSEVTKGAQRDVGVRTYVGSAQKAKSMSFSRRTSPLLAILMSVACGGPTRMSEPGSPVSSGPDDAASSGGGGGDSAAVLPEIDATPDASYPAEAGRLPSDDGGAMPDGSEAGGDEAPGRSLMVNTTNPQLYTINFKPSDADPQASAHDDVQTALVDTTKQMRAKLVVTLSGVGSGPAVGIAQYAASLGFHAYAIAYENGYDPSTQSNPDYFGNSRNNELFGMGLTPGIMVNRPDSVEVRVTKALTYLQTANSAGDWSYYFDASGKVRWSDVIFIGHSHGASSAAYYAKVLRLWRAISLSGPRDTNPVIATWLTIPSATPIERYYGFTGTLDPQHPDHIESMQIMGYLGVLTDVMTTPAPYNDSHRLQYDGAHNDSANCANYDPACKYMFGVQ